MSEQNGSEKLRDLKEGDLFELGSLFPGLDGGEEKIAWFCLENAKLGTVEPARPGDTRRITLHAHYHDVFLMPAVVIVDDAGNQDWRIG